MCEDSPRKRLKEDLSEDDPEEQNLRLDELKRMVGELPLPRNGNHRNNSPVPGADLNDAAVEHRQRPRIMD